MDQGKGKEAVTAMIDLNFFDDLSDEEFLAMTESLTEKEQMTLMVLRQIDGTVREDAAGDSDVYERAAHELDMTADEVKQTEARALDTLERLYSGWRQGKFVIVHKDGSREEF